MNHLYYVLRDGVPVPEPNRVAWLDWFEAADRQVARTTIGDLVVSTVFLACDHSHGDGPPILWESMTFFDGATVSFHRCAGTITAARAMHERVCGWVRAGEILPWGEDDTSEQPRPAP